MAKKTADVDLQGFYDECVETLPWSDIDNWESDLYIKSTPQSDYLVSKYGLKDEALFSMFVSEGAVWYEIPFGYMPFWEKLSKTAAGHAVDSAYEYYINGGNAYMLLGRCIEDVKYWNGYGGHADKHLWAGDPQEQYDVIEFLYSVCEPKPEWFTDADLQDIKNVLGAN